MARILDNLLPKAIMTGIQCMSRLSLERPSQRGLSLKSGMFGMSSQRWHGGMTLAQLMTQTYSRTAVVGVWMEIAVPQLEILLPQLKTLPALLSFLNNNMTLKSRVPHQSRSD